MEKEVKENLDKIIKGADTLLATTNKGIVIYGEGSKTLTALTLLLREMSTKFPKDVLQKCFDLGLCSEEEINSMLRESLTQMLEDLKKKASENE